MSDRPARPWARNVEPKCPEWMTDGMERLEKKRQDAILENRKRQRGVLDEAPGAAAAAGESLPPPGGSSSGHGDGLPAPASPPEDVSRPEDMNTFRHATMTPASFAPARHLYMCCGRPIVVHLLMSLSPPPPFLITTWFDASKIGGIRPICFELFSGASCFFGFRSHASSRAYRLTLKFAFTLYPHGA